MAISSWLGTSLSDVRRGLVPIRRHCAIGSAAFMTVNGLCLQFPVSDA